MNTYIVSLEGINYQIMIDADSFSVEGDYIVFTENNKNQAYFIRKNVIEIFPVKKR